MAKRIWKPSDKVMCAVCDRTQTREGTDVGVLPEEAEALGWIRLDEPGEKPRYVCPYCDPADADGETFVRGRRGRPNPSEPKDPKDIWKAIDKYLEFHQRDPKQMGTLPNFKWPKNVYLKGYMVTTYYQSDKWSRKRTNYYHDHGGGVRVYTPPADGAATKLPSWITSCETVIKLGDCWGFDFTSTHNETVEARIGRGKAGLYTIPSGKALLVIEGPSAHARLEAVMWGGGLDVRDVGIVE